MCEREREKYTCDTIWWAQASETEHLTQSDMDEKILRKSDQNK